MTNIQLKLLRVGGTTRTTPWNGQQITAWEGDVIEMFAQYFQADNGVLLSFNTDSADQFSSLPSPYSSTSSTGSAWGLNLATKNNSIKDGDRIVNMRLLDERSSNYQDFSILIMDDDFGLSGQQSNSGPASAPQNTSQGNVTTINGSGNTVINGNGNTVNATTTVINNVTNNINNGTINNYTFSVGTINIDMSGALQGTSKKADAVTGTSGDDVIASGVGKDVLTGNEGADTFVLNTEDKFGKKGADKVADFDAASGDKLVIDPEAFPGSELGVASGTEMPRRCKQKDLTTYTTDQMVNCLTMPTAPKKGSATVGLLRIFLAAPS